MLLYIVLPDENCQSAIETLQTKQYQVKSVIYYQVAVRPKIWGSWYVRLSFLKYNFRTAQLTQWAPALLVLMWKVVYLNPSPQCFLLRNWGTKHHFFTAALQHIVHKMQNVLGLHSTDHVLCTIISYLIVGIWTPISPKARHFSGAVESNPIDPPSSLTS